MYTGKFRLVKWHEKSFHTYVIKLLITLSTLSFIQFSIIPSIWLEFILLITYKILFKQRDLGFLFYFSLLNF